MNISDIKSRVRKFKYRTFFEEEIKRSFESDYENKFVRHIYSGNGYRFFIAATHEVIQHKLDDTVVHAILYNISVFSRMKKTDYIFHIVNFDHDPQFFREYMEILKLCNEHNPNFKIENNIILCNESFAVRELRILGFNAIFCHHNMILDYENIYQILDVEKTFDAVCSTRGMKYKRNYLFKGIPNIAIIQHGANEFKWVGYEPKWINEYFVDSKTVNKITNESHCGIIVSAKEGGNLSTTQYLLAGIPVISTPNEGGRDHYLNNENSIRVSADKQCIKEAVEEAKSRDWDREAIRRGAIEIIDKDRRIFMDIMESIASKYDEVKGQDIWEKSYSDKFKLYDLQNVGSYL